MSPQFTRDYRRAPWVQVSKIGLVAAGTEGGGAFGPSSEVPK